MDKFEKLVNLGLNVEEATLLTTPVAELKLNQIKMACAACDKRNELVREKNKEFIPSGFGGGVQIISKGFEPFQSPCNTDVIITSEHQRQDDMKRNGCFDAREAIPHGKTSVLDAKL